VERVARIGEREVERGVEHKNLTRAMFGMRHHP
jgi:hypothetical protein